MLCVKKQPSCLTKDEILSLNAFKYSQKSTYEETTNIFCIGSVGSGVGIDHWFSNLSPITGATM